ncbi:D-amino acid aminotransferase [Amphritea sp. 2_MG-2023]|uniref:D-amino acid aminotransferase n=1 Tax=Amphritea TaxID=515417 RepID=UPI001C06D064|nr:MULTISPECIES: D-amino acid aminotransferase [Amphritea]MBU2967572.1 D-amino acid aminotransferase [Amphritea atlantica]MDO6419060.1 D-amino acid aminotransferase [Amphritea sp. 2_MG-2023]
MNIVFLNGDYISEDQAKVSVFDRGFLFGDSVYEVIPFYQGVSFRLDEHLQRLQYSLRAIQITADFDWNTILTRLVELNGGGNLSVYLQISRGNTGRRSHIYDADMIPTVFACCNPIKDIYNAGPDAVSGVRAIVTDDLRWGRCDIKSTGLLPNILVMQQAKQAGAQEALMMRDGLLTEGASCNLMLVEKGVIYTPKRGSEILGGTTRELILELAGQGGIAMQEADISYARLLAADEVWVSSSTRAVVPVVEIDGQPVADGNKGPLWARMFELFTRYQDNLMNG